MKLFSVLVLNTQVMDIMLKSWTKLDKHIDIQVLLSMYHYIIILLRCIVLDEPKSLYWQNEHMGFCLNFVDFGT